MERKLKGEAMKTKVITILAAAVILSFTAAHLYAVPVDKIFTSSGQIIDGEEWNNVSIYNDDTIVDMLGGLVDQMQTYDSSMLNVTGGVIYSLYAWNYSVANISSGSVYGVSSCDYTTVNLSVTGNVATLHARFSGTINIMGGTAEYLGALDSGTINIYGGLITEYLGAWNDAVVNIYGYDFNYDPLGGSLDGGQLKGFWFDSTAFTIDLNGLETYSHINLIPEPNTLVLLAIGCFLMKRKK